MSKLIYVPPVIESVTIEMEAGIAFASNGVQPGDGHVEIQKRDEEKADDTEFGFFW